eukprot:529270-Prymnesium_polylepis.1
MWDLPPLMPVSVRPDETADQPEPEADAGQQRPLLRPQRRRPPGQELPPAGKAWDGEVFAWMRRKVQAHAQLSGELHRYLAKPDRTPQTEESCLRAFYRRAAERPAVALELTLDFLLMERWRDELIAECTRNGMRLVSRREDASSARRKLRALVDPVLRKASARLQGGKLECDRLLHRESAEYAGHVVRAARAMLQERSQAREVVDAKLKDTAGEKRARESDKPEREEEQPPEEAADRPL